jgi:AcrR family transcriptional regulator
MSATQPETAPPTRSTRGRQAEAARNDTAILEAARAVFLRDSSASMATVAEEAGGGVGGLYRRYAGRDELLRTLCGNGLRHFTALAEEALAEAPRPGTDDAWASLTRFLTGVVDSDVHALTVHLAGTFRSTPELRQLAQRSGELVEELVRRAHASGRLRPDVGAGDLPMVFEQLSAVRVEDDERTQALRRRYLALQLDSLRVHPGTSMPAVQLPPGPTPEELGERWSRSQ